MQLLNQNYNTDVKCISREDSQFMFALKNTGREDWPVNCKIVQSGGDELNILPINVGSVKPGITRYISVYFKAPESAGTYKSLFKVCYKPTNSEKEPEITIG